MVLPPSADVRTWLKLASLARKNGRLSLSLSVLAELLDVDARARAGSAAETLAALQRAHPALTLEVRLQDRFADLVRDGIDLAVRLGELNDSTLVARRIDAQRLLLVASPDYLRQHGTARRLEDLSGHRAVAFRLATSGRSRPWQLRQGRRPIEMFPVHAIQLSDTEALGTAAKLGMGLCQLPDDIVQDDLASGDLVELLLGLEPPPMPISAVVPSGRLVPPRVRVALAALDALRTRVGG
jgi:DNA-binding transcriptional LysR family regulator